MVHIPIPSLRRLALTSLVGLSAASFSPIGLANTATPKGSVTPTANDRSTEKLSRSAILDLIASGQAGQAVDQLQNRVAANPQDLSLANDLALLLANLGQTTQAREVLERALLAHPEAAATFKNLRELAALQFSESYAKALGQKAQPRKVALEASLNLSPEEVRQALAVADERAKAKAKAEALAKAEAERLARLEASKIAQAKAEQSRAAPEGIVSGEPVDLDRAKQQLPPALTAWASAWASKDFVRYASFYAKSYKTTEHANRDKWLAFRKPRIVNKGRILVEVSAIQVSEAGANRFEVKFSQRYESGTLKVRVRKRQVWVVEDGLWRIQSEQA